MNTIKPLSFVAICIVLYIFLHNFFIGITSIPTEGDSIHYHIPVAEFYLKGIIMNPPDKEMIIRWYPSASESILALFIVSHVPLNLYNVFATAILGIVCYKLGRLLLKNSYLAILFASSCITTHGILRLQHTQNIDIWLAIFFVLSVYLLHKPEKTILYFLKLGICIGMVIGSKYSGPMMASAILLVYGKKILPYISPSRFIIFCLPVMVIGISWYVRNLLITGSPVYPQGLLFFPGYHGWTEKNFSFMSYPMWKALLFYPNYTISAFISEYGIWICNLLIIPIVSMLIICKGIVINNKMLLEIIKNLLLLTIISYFFFFLLPAEEEYKHILLGMRYSFGPLIISILVIFILISQLFKNVELFSFIIIANMLIMLPLNYHPKILFIYIPLVAVCWYVFNKQRVNKLLY